MLPPLLVPTARVDLGELKLQLAKRLGAQRARRYFSYLQSLLSQKLSKSEFNKLCFLTLGRENLPLHNQLIRSVLSNACQARTPPLQRKPLKKEDCLNLPQPHIWENGDILPSPRSILGPNESINVSVQQNGDFCFYGLERQVEGQGSEQKKEHVKWCRLSSKGLEEVVISEDGESFVQMDDCNMCLSTIRPPLGIPVCGARVGRIKRSLPCAESASIYGFSSYLNNGELCHTEDLRKRMESVAEIQGLGGVTMECAILLNSGLDVYLKRLIKSCIELVGVRKDCETIKQPLQKKEAHGKLINGVWLTNLAHVLRSNGSLELKERNCCLISLHDFTGAMELNPKQLGTHAPLLLEKIRLHSFTE